MPTAFDQNAQDVGMSLDSIAEEIENGLVLHADRLVAAFDNEEYYACRNIVYIQRRESEEWRDFVKRPKRASRMMRKAINTLGRHLYNPGPTRRVKNSAEADAFLDDVYKKNHINAMMSQADDKATMNGFSAIQAHVSGRPEKPIILYLWGAHELVVWTWPDDPTEVWAVCTITRQRQAKGAILEQRLEYNVWSRDEHRVYQTKWIPVPLQYSYAQDQYRGLFGKPSYFLVGMSGDPVGSCKNPYGILPFSFVHDEMIVDDFYAGGIGNALRECNAEVDRELSDLADHAREFMSPDRFLLGVSPNWRRERSISRWQILTPGKNSEGEAAEPQPIMVQGDLAIASVWENIQAYVNNTFEDLDVPLVSVRVDASTDLSGIAIVAKHMPLIERARQRQPVFTVNEEALASMIFHVAGVGYELPALSAVGEDLDMETIWPPPRFPLPTMERNDQDTWEMDQGIKSLVDVVAERTGTTQEEAWQIIERVAEDNEKLKPILAPPPEPGQEPGTTQEPSPFSANGQPKTDPEEIGQLDEEEP